MHIKTNNKLNSRQKYIGEIISGCQIHENYTYRSMKLELHFTPGLKFMIIHTEH